MADAADEPAVDEGAKDRSPLYAHKSPEEAQG